ncbi:hypothetical protein L1049_009037 [Liquidambar formosana]|uniref:Uncharacterized protein n=1 Tax=Liquidambar formosana TaxID=63359 RepID=A0AAP0X2N6_LIQFO
MMKETNGSENTTIDIGDVERNQQLASSIRGKLRAESRWPTQCCIFRVPTTLRRHNEGAYVPSIVSIGPFHDRGDKNLEEMERVKLWYLDSLLLRSPTAQTSLECFVSAIRKIEPNCRACYAEQLINLSCDQFVEMMVVDGCFIIELFRKYKKKDLRHKADPLFNMSWMRLALAHDMLLLENQLPWEVLEVLWNLTTRHTRDQRDTNFSAQKEDRQHVDPLDIHALRFFSTAMLTVAPEPHKRSTNKHLLDFLRNSLLSSFTDMTLEETSWEPIPCVTELLQAGVRFEVGNKNDLLNIKFNNGVMRIPPIFIQENAESLFRNLIAFEQCDHSCYNKITSYAIILDSLINSSEDVDFLRERGIIRNSLSTEDVAGFFHRLYNGAGVDNFAYAKLCKDLNNYSETPWHRWQAILKRDYFNTPWAILSFSAAILILGFTFIQTLLAVFSYSDPFRRS